MIIKCCIIENSAECANAIKEMESRIPCFSSLDLLDENSIEYTISCREEDVIYVEKTLAEFV